MILVFAHLLQVLSEKGSGCQERWKNSVNKEDEKRQQQQHNLQKNYKSSFQE